MSFIRVEQLAYTYTPPNQAPTQALCGVNLSVEEGEYVAIVGANGSGKSTLARHLNALLLPTSGDVWIGGRNTRDPEATRAIRSDVAMVFQSPADQIVATIVEEDVAFGPENLGVSEDRLPEVVRSALARVTMWDARDRPPHMLSAGQQQRVAIAGALAMNPRCIVLDEAGAMLDPKGRSDLLHILNDLRQVGITVLSITHSMSEAAQADRMIAMDKGTVALDAAPSEAFASTELASLGLAVPPVTQLARRLHERVPQIPAGVLSVKRLVDHIAGLGNDKANHCR